MPHLIYILFLFAVGACVGSFLNVVIWRLPRGESISTPPSHCPRCNTRLRWYDNIPILAWLALRGRCRYCAEPISARYPIIETVTGLLFAFYYVMFFIVQSGPTSPAALAGAVTTGRIGPTRLLSIEQDWPMYGLFMVMIASLLAASLIDAEQFIIPLEIPWLLAAVGVSVHAVIDRPMQPGALNVNPMLCAIAAGGGVGLLVSALLLWRGALPRSFPDGEVMEIDRAAPDGKPVEPDQPPIYTRSQLMAEMRREMVFLLPPMLLAMAAWTLVATVEPVGRWWAQFAGAAWLSGLLGAVLGGLVGGLVVWVTRILGTIGFGKLAMGLGDVHLMFGVGAIIGAGPATVAFFLAPFFGLLMAIYTLLSGRTREMPYGPYLSMASAFMLLSYPACAAYLAPGVAGLVVLVRQGLGLS